MIVRCGAPQQSRSLSVCIDVSYDWLKVETGLDRVFSFHQGRESRLYIGGSFAFSYSLFTVDF